MTTRTLAVLILLAGAAWIAYTSLGLRPVPRCQEDTFILGTGDFSQGRWSLYICGPAVDDFLPPRSMPGHTA